MRALKSLAIGVALGGLLMMQSAASGAERPDGVRDVLSSRLTDAAAGVGGGSRPGSGKAAGQHTRLIGKLGIPGGLHGDVWSHGDFAYVGTWSGPCPGTGVKIIDVSDPAAPHVVATAAGYPNTSAEDMQVISVATESFTGDLLAVGLQNCFLEDEPPGLTGIDLWDVSDPTSPSRLGFFDVAPTDGVHEISLTKQVVGDTERVFALAAVPFSEVVTSLVFGPEAAIGDFQVVEVTDPSNPTLADDWGAGKDGNLPFGSPLFGLPAPFDCSPAPAQPDLCRGHFPAVFAHSTSPSADGARAYVAYWDAGAVVLDISTPDDVQFVGRTLYPAGSEGDTHSAVDNAAGTILVTTDEDFSPGERRAAGEPKLVGDTWGFARIWSLDDPAAPGHLSDYATPHSLTNKTDAFYSAHNPEIRGTTLYLSWYSDGLRVVDISIPAAPREIASFRPPPTRDPTGAFVGFGARDAPFPFVWGVHVDGDRIYLSDINFGLYIVALR